jgi:hypothetical protein
MQAIYLYYVVELETTPSVQIYCRGFECRFAHLKMYRVTINLE